MLDWLGSMWSRKAGSSARRLRGLTGLELLESRLAPAVTPLPPLGEGLNMPRYPIEEETRQVLNLVPPPLSITVRTPAPNAASQNNFFISGVVNTGNLAATSLKARTDRGGFVPVAVDPNGRFGFNTTFALNGTAEGGHTIILEARDLGGRVSSREVNVRIDTIDPTVKSFSLNTASDTGTTGDHRTNLASVTLTGVTEPGASVVLDNTGEKVTAAANGQFSFTSIALTEGANTFTVKTTDAVGNQATFSRVITRDSTLPVIDTTTGLTNDTGASNTDKITKDPTIAGTITEDSTIISFLASLDTDVLANFVEMKAELNNGAFTFDLAKLTTINRGNTVADGAHTLRLRATDAAGNVTAIFTFGFTLDRAVAPPTLTLDAASDTSPTGDHATTLGTITLQGTTEAGATVVLVNTGATTVASSTGQFTFSNLTLNEGTTNFSVQATDTAGNQSTFNRVITRDSALPVVTAALVNDTGSSNSDLITKDPTVSGTVTDVSAISSFVASIDNAQTAAFVDVTTFLTGSSFTFSAAQLAAINGGSPLSDGVHVLRLRATDAVGNVSTVFTLTFTLDTTIATPTLDLADTSDTDPLGDHQTTLDTITLQGITEPGATVVLTNTSVSSPTSGTGAFAFINVALPLGDTAFTADATDAAGNTASFTRTITRT